MPLRESSCLEIGESIFVKQDSDDLLIQAILLNYRQLLQLNAIVLDNTDAVIVNAVQDIGARPASVWLGHLHQIQMLKVANHQA